MLCLNACHRSTTASTPEIAQCDTAVVVVDTALADTVLTDSVVQLVDTPLVDRRALYAADALQRLQFSFRRQNAKRFFSQLAALQKKGFYLNDGWHVTEVNNAMSPLDVFDIMGLNEGPASPRFYGSADLQMCDLQGSINKVTMVRERCDSIIDGIPYGLSILYTDSLIFNRNGTLTNMRQALNMGDIVEIKRNDKGRLLNLVDDSQQVYTFAYKEDGNLMRRMREESLDNVVYSTYRYNKQGDLSEINQIQLGATSATQKIYYKVLQRDSYGNWTQRLRRDIMDNQTGRDTTNSVESRTILYW